MMGKIRDLDDYQKYFVKTPDGVLIHTDLFNRRQQVGRRIWTLLKIMMGDGTTSDVLEFERDVFPYSRMRSRFNKLRQHLFDQVSARDGSKCAVCGTQINLTVDHIQPLSRGGSNDLDNLQILCMKHNQNKGAR